MLCIQDSILHCMASFQKTIYSFVNIVPVISYIVHRKVSRRLGINTRITRTFVIISLCPQFLKTSYTVEVIILVCVEYVQYKYSCQVSLLVIVHTIKAITKNTPHNYSSISIFVFSVFTTCEQRIVIQFFPLMFSTTK